MKIKTFGETPVPAWIVHEVTAAAKKLGIHHNWYISIAMSEKPHGMDKDGASYTELPYLQTGLEFKPDIQNDAAGRDLVWHEVCHIATAPLLEAAYKAMNQIKNKQTRNLMKRIIDEAEERLVNELTAGLLEGKDDHQTA